MKTCRLCQERIAANSGGHGFDVQRFPWVHTTKGGDRSAPYPVCEFTPQAQP